MTIQSMIIPEFSCFLNIPGNLLATIVALLFSENTRDEECRAPVMT